LALSFPMLKRLRRFLFFVLLGYAMHVPVRTVHEVKWLDAAGWQSWFQVDVLQCIGLSLAVAAFPRGWAPILRDTPVRGFQSFPGQGTSCSVPCWRAFTVTTRPIRRDFPYGSWPGLVAY